MQPVPGCHYQTHHERFLTVYTQDLTDNVKAGAVFSLSRPEQLPVTVRGETTVTSVVQTW